MDGKTILMGIFTIALLAWLIHGVVYNALNHVICSNPSALRPDAKIIKVETKKVNSGFSVRRRTTVTFDDGFQYVSHKTNTQTHFGSYTISLGSEDKRQILNEARAAHKNEMAKHS